MPTTTNLRKKNRLTTLLLASALLLPILTGCNNQGTSSEATSHITRAETYADQGQFRSALLEVRNAVQAEPDNVSHIVHLGELYLRIGAAQQASNLLEPWLEDHAAQVAIPLAEAYVNQGKHLSATETLARHNAANPQDQLRASLIRAEALRIAGDKAEALALFRSLVDNHPANLNAITGTLKTQIDLNQNSQAIRTADDWMASHRPEPRVQYWKGLGQYRENDLENAAATLTDAAGRLPTSDVFLPIRRQVLTALSRVLTEQGKMAEAQVYNKILADNQNSDAREQGEAAVAALREGNIDEAKTILRDMLKLDPENQQAALMLGALETGSGELDEGARLLTENLDPETTPTLFLRAAAMAQIDQGHRAEALKTLERAMQARPDDNEIIAMHGILALSLPGKENEGVASLSKAISTEPERTRLRLALAQHYLNNNQPEQALGQLRMAFAAEPEDWHATGTYMNLLLAQGEEAEAAELRDSLLNGYGDMPQAVLLSSLADSRLGNTVAATERLKKLTQQQPDMPQARMALAALLVRMGEHEQAINELLTLARQNPEAIQPLQQAAQLYARDHSPQQMQQWLSDLAKHSPALEQSADVLAALIHVGNNELAPARNLLEKWSDSKSAAVQRALGQLLVAETRAAVRAEDYTGARSKAAEAATLAPDNHGFALLAVGISQAEGKYPQALDELQAVEDNLGSTTATALARASILESQGGVGAAWNYLHGQWLERRDTALMPTLLRLAPSQNAEVRGELTSQWLDREPQSVAANLARADWLMHNNQDQLATHHYNYVLEQQPDNIAALNNLAWLLREDNTKRALELARMASEQAPKNSAVLDTYGWVLHLAGEHQQAVATLEKALALAPGNEDITSHLEDARKAL